MMRWLGRLGLWIGILFVLGTGHNASLAAVESARVASVSDAASHADPQCNLLLLGTGTCGSSVGPIVFDAATEGTEVSSDTQTVSHTTGSGSKRLLLAIVAWNGTATVSSVTYNSIALTSTTAANSPYSNHKTQIWYLVAPSTGANNLVVTLSASSALNTAVVTYTGVDQTTPVENVTSSSNDINTMAVTVTSAVGDLAFAAVHRSGGTLVPDAGQTERFNAFDSAILFAGGDKTGAASVTLTWTTSGTSPWSMVGVSINAG